MNRTLNWYLDYPRFLREILSGAKAASELSTAKLRTGHLNGVVDFSRPLSVLDLANGALCPQYYILAAEGHRVVGVDLVNRPKRSPTAFAYRVARGLYRRTLYDRTVPNGARRRGNGLICADVAALPFKDGAFDLVTSIAAFEHFLDVPKVLSEVARVLKPGGTIWAAIHVFSTLSGGHNVSRSMSTPFPAGVDPWDHLRKRELPFSVPLNEWRIGRYLDAFSSRFEILSHGPTGSEGAALLTAEFRTELSEYSVEELTCCGYFITARKHTAGA